MLSERSKGSDPRRFDYTFVGRNLPAGSAMGIKRATWKRAAVAICGLVFCGLFLNAPALPAQKKKNRHSGASTGAAAATSSFAKRVDTLLGAEPASKGEWGLLVADAETGQTLFEQNAAKYFVPASNMKLFTTALALDKLGADFRFHTTLESAGVVSPEGELSADLVLVGRGDPNLSNRKFPFNLKEEFDGPPERALAELADALVAKGIKKISGDVIGDDSYFPRERYPNGWEIDDMVWEYGAAISAIVVNDNTVTVTLTPGQVGDAVQAVVSPHTPDFLMDNEVTTSAANAKPDLTLTREPGAHLVVVRGTLPEKSAPRKLVLAIEEPALHAATLLKALLEQRGVPVDGGVRARHETITAEGITPTVLAEHVSIPLGDSVKLVNKISQNLHTEVLLRTAMRQAGTWNSFDDVAKFAAGFYARMGIAAQDIIQTDGSGLSRHDMVTPRAMLSLLRYAQTRPWFESFFASLPVAGVDGTLEERMKNTPAAGRVHAKTGSVEHVRTLSGFADTAGGRRLAFSFMTNNEYGKNHETTDAMNGLCLAMIEEFNAVPAKRSREHKQPQ
jgi:D-alanyl-D-alanine carboxypeptidase/D-alanyl-D-alanine-endopeptidase (penicillin-binding protein 4)